MSTDEKHRIANVVLGETDKLSNDQLHRIMFRGIIIFVASVVVFCINWVTFRTFGNSIYFIGYACIFIDFMTIGTACIGIYEIVYAIRNDRTVNDVIAIEKGITYRIDKKNNILYILLDKKKVIKTIKLE